ncbi:MAG: hypothetical protein ACREC4_00270 [Methylocella sp.]
MTDIALVYANKMRDSLAAKINSLAQQIDDLKLDLAKVDAWIAQWREFAGKDEAATPAPHSAARSARTSGNPTKEHVGAKVKELILEKGAPIARNDLFEALESRGVIIRGVDPQMVLSTMLWRTFDIVHLRGHGYWLKDRPFDPAAYRPDRPFEDANGFNRRI